MRASARVSLQAPEQDYMLRACSGISARLTLQVPEQSSRKLSSQELWDTSLAEPASMAPALFQMSLSRLQLNCC